MGLDILQMLLIYCFEAFRPTVAWSVGHHYPSHMVWCEIIGDLATYLVQNLCPLFCNGIFWYLRTCTLMVLKLQQESFLDLVGI